MTLCTIQISNITPKGNASFGVGSVLGGVLGVYASQYNYDLAAIKNALVNNRWYSELVVRRDISSGSIVLTIETQIDKYSYSSLQILDSAASILVNFFSKFTLTTFGTQNQFATKTYTDNYRPQTNSNSGGVVSAHNWNTQNSAIINAVSNTTNSALNGANNATQATEQAIRTQLQNAGMTAAEIQAYIDKQTSGLGLSAYLDKFADTLGVSIPLALIVLILFGVVILKK